MRTITGRIIDTETRDPIPYVNIALGIMYQGAFAPIGQGTMSDDEGNFSFTYTPDGAENDRLQFSHLGYETRVYNPAQLQGGLPNDIALRATTYEVPEAEVVASHARMNLLPFVLILAVLSLLAFIKSSEG